MLIVFGGLPGVGKSAIAAAVARRLGAAWLRIDVIEVAMTRGLGLPAEGDIGPTGYIVAYDLARSNLSVGVAVVADSVNQIAETRTAWREVAASAGAPCLEVEVVCTDLAEHRRRVEARLGDPAALQPADLGRGRGPRVRAVAAGAAAARHRRAQHRGRGRAGLRSGVAARRRLRRISGSSRPRGSHLRYI